jgi:cyclopropane fatty-acyl-phospholipid synthase-like methyltransferase
MLRNLNVPVKLTALDLSASSMATAQKVRQQKIQPQRSEGRVYARQHYVVAVSDESFDLIVTSGVLEYVPLEEGFR